MGCLSMICNDSFTPFLDELATSFVLGGVNSFETT
jgi:hypothetical protein